MNKPWTVELFDSDQDLIDMIRNLCFYKANEETLKDFLNDLENHMRKDIGYPEKKHYKLEELLDEMTDENIHTNKEPSDVDQYLNVIRNSKWKRFSEEDPRYDMFIDHMKNNDPVDIIGPSFHGVIEHRYEFLGMQFKKVFSMSDDKDEFVIEYCCP